MSKQLGHRGYVCERQREHRSNVLPSVSANIRTYCRRARSTDGMFSSGYYLAHGQEGQVVGDCLSDVTSGFSGVWAHTDGGSIWSVMSTTVSVASSTVGAIAIVGWNIKETAVSTSPPSSNIMPTITGGLASSTNPALVQSPADGSTPTLATGTAVGIGVGVALGVLGFISLLVSFCLIRRRKHKRERNASAGGTSETISAFGDAHAKLSQICPTELESERSVSEMHSEYLRAYPAELSG